MYRTTLSTLVAGLVTLAAAAGAPPSAAAQNASLYAVHGIPGDELGLAVALPVDVTANGSCVAALNGLTFGEIRGPLSLPAGSYAIEVKLANAIDPCSGPTTGLTATVTLQAGGNYSLVAHLTDTAAPTLSAYANDVSRTPPGGARVIVHHTAAAPAVNITLRRGAGSGSNPAAVVDGLANPGQATATVRPGEYRLSIAPSSAPDTVVFGPAGVAFQPFTTTLVYAIGNIGTGTFRLATREVVSR